MRLPGRANWAGYLSPSCCVRISASPSPALITRTWCGAVACTTPVQRHTPRSRHHRNMRVRNLHAKTVKLTKILEQFAVGSQLSRLEMNDPDSTIVMAEKKTVCRSARNAAIRDLKLGGTWRCRRWGSRKSVQIADSMRDDTNNWLRPQEWL